MGFRVRDQLKSENFKNLCAIWEDHNRNILLFIVGLVFAFFVVYYHFYRVYLDYFFLAIGFLCIAKSLNIQSIGIGMNGLVSAVFNQVAELKAESKVLHQEIKEIEGVIEIIAPIVVPLILKVYEGNKPEIYNVLKMTTKSERLCNETDQLKQELSRWILERFSCEPKIEALSKMTTENEERVKDFCKAFKTKSRSGNAYEWPRQELVSFRDDKIIQNLSDAERDEYIKVINYYIERIDELINNSTIEEGFFTSGARQ